MRSPRDAAYELALKLPPPARSLLWRTWALLQSLGQSLGEARSSSSARRDRGRAPVAPPEPRTPGGPGAPGIESWKVELPFTEDNFDEDRYLATQLDVGRAVALGEVRSGREHFVRTGAREGRCFREPAGIEQLRSEKLRRLEPRLRLALPHRRRGQKYDFLTPELRSASGISQTKNVGSNGYDGYVTKLIEDHRDGLLLDCGAGQRQRYYANVVNYEIVDYDTTDVLGVGEELPFLDGSFDGAISIAVLEHVRDPFQCARELVRVLKPGGRLICCVPFLQPLHGYPHHYYNMTHQGLRALFERTMEIEDHRVIEAIGPIWSLTWIVQSWAAGLPAGEREEFLSLPLRALTAHPLALLGAPWVTALSGEKNFELASATMLFARKP